MEIEMEDEPRIFPRSSAFEALLARVYLELWEIQDEPAIFNRRVEIFVNNFLPSMFQNKLRDEKRFPDLNAKMLKTRERVGIIEQARAKADPLTQIEFSASVMPSEESEFWWDVWHAVIDVLTEAGFNFPMAMTKPRARMRP